MWQYDLVNRRMCPWWTVYSWRTFYFYSSKQSDAIFRPTGDRNVILHYSNCIYDKDKATQQNVKFKWKKRTVSDQIRSFFCPRLTSAFMPGFRASHLSRLCVCAGGNWIPVTATNGLWRTRLIPRACIQRGIKGGRGRGQAPETIQAWDCASENITQVWESTFVWAQSLPQSTAASSYCPNYLA